MSDGGLSNGIIRKDFNEQKFVALPGAVSWQKAFF